MAITIRSKIILSFGAIVLLLIFLEAASYYTRSIMHRAMLGLTKEVRRLELLADLSLSVNRLIMPANDYLITGDRREMEAYKRLEARVEKALGTLDGGLPENPGHGAPDRRAMELFDIVRDKAEEIFSLEDPVGNKRGALLMEEMDAAADKLIVEYINRWHEIEKSFVKETIKYADTVKRRADGLFLVSMAASLLFSAGLVAYLTRSILIPILEFKDGAVRIREGNLDHRIDVRDGLEINILAEEFNRMAEKLKESYAGLEAKVEERTKELKELNERFRRLSITDELTGLFNRRYFYERLTEEAKRAKRYGRPLSLIMLDIDHFKHYNDCHGHIKGDCALRDVASCIKKNTREQDVVARYGGEEFSIILPETGRENAIAIGERIRKGVKDFLFAGMETQPGGRVTASLGVAALGDDADDADALIRKADEALYRAKEKGRNRVEAA